MLLAASILENIFSKSIPVIFIEIFGAGFAIFGFVNFFRHNNVKSQLAAKDAVIATNQQTINSIEDRLKVVEDELAIVKEDLATSNKENKTLTDELRDWENRYKHLENYAAPALGEQLIEMFQRQEIILDKIVNALEGIQNRIHTLESKSE
jgi:septal ring factor EnvC (AmiA/AmiB activator)